RPRAPGEGAVPGVLDVPCVPRRGVAVGLAAAWPGAVRVRAAAVLHLRAEHRAGTAAGDAALRDGRDRVEPTRGRVAGRAVPSGPGRAGGIARGTVEGRSTGVRPLRRRESGERPQARSGRGPGTGGGEGR